MKNRNKQTKFPVARIKKIMQKDEEVGKVSQATPVVISKALELFLAMLVNEAAIVTIQRNSKRVENYHLKHAINHTTILDFLKEIVDGVPDPSAGGTIDIEAEKNEAKRRRAQGAGAGAGAGRKRKRKGEAEAEAEADVDVDPEVEVEAEAEAAVDDADAVDDAEYDDNGRGGDNRDGGGNDSKFGHRARSWTTGPGHNNALRGGGGGGGTDGEEDTYESDRDWD